MAKLDDVFLAFDALGASYRAEKFDPGLVPPVVAAAFAVLETECKSRFHATLASGTFKKDFHVFVNNADASDVSRPFRPSLWIKTYSEWEDGWNKMVGAIDPKGRRIDYDDIDRVLYTAAIAFFAALDIFKRNDRKSNGTFLEWILGILLVRATKFTLGRHVPLLRAAESLEEGDSEEDDPGSVPTDIVLDPKGGQTRLVFPVKTSTRERINQIFTHQRILETEFPGGYRSALLCVSECQLIKRTNKKTGVVTVAVQETCVPQQVSFNEHYIAHIDALYYLDAPFRYVDGAITVPVRKMSDLFRTDLAAVTRLVEAAAKAECGETVSVVKCNQGKGHPGEHLYVPLRGPGLDSTTLTLKDVAD